MSLLPRYFLYAALMSLLPPLISPSLAQSNTNRAVMERLDSMERNLSLMQRQISKGSAGRDSTDADASPIMGNMDGDLLQQIIALQEEMRDLRGQVEKNTYEVDRVKDQVKRMQDDVDFRLQALENKASATPAPEASLTQEPPIAAEPDMEPVAQTTSLDTKKNDDPELSQPQKKPVNAPEADPEATTAGSGVLAKPGTKYGDQPRTHYNEAFRLLNQNRYDEAQQAFASFTTAYPSDPLIGNAYYWLGETFYIQEKFVDAADKFREGYQKLPDGPKAPDNLLKLAMSLKALDRTSDACTILSQIEKKFSNSSSNLLQRTKAEKKLMSCP